MTFLKSLYIIILILSIGTPTLKAQKQFVIHGTITDSNSGEQMPGVIIYQAIPKKSITSNYYGYYNISSPSGKIILNFMHLGYEKKSLVIELKSDTTIHVVLNQIQQQLKEVEVTASRLEDISTQPGVISLKINQVKSIPVLLGEADILKAIQLLPGVKFGTEGTSGLYVRGGSPDQNLIMLDGIPIYNVSHLFGLFSVFNPDAISGFNFYKGGLPARYSGRLSSVLDIKMKEGNNKKITGEASVGLIASKFTLEGPLKNENTSYILSLRRTFLDLILLPFMRAGDKSDKTPTYSFYDINAKINHKINDKNRIYLSVYAGNDRSGTRNKYTSDGSKFQSVSKLGWGNMTTALRWNTLMGKRLFSNTTIVYSKYQFITEENNKETENDKGTLKQYLNRYSSGIQDIGLKWDMDYFTNENHNIKFGLNATNHSFNPGVFVFVDKGIEGALPIDTTFGNRKIVVNEATAYIEDEFRIKNITTNLGLNYTYLSVKDTGFHCLQPRLSAAWQINKKTILKASYGITSQYLHLLTNSSIGLPTDLWLPATKKAVPQRANQYSAGLYYTFNNAYNIAVEYYYKSMQNLIEYKEGASIYGITDSWEDKIETGNGSAQGIELFIQKQEGRLTGWIGTTLSKSDRTFKNLNFGRTFPFKFDSRFDISIVAAYKINDRINLNANWVYHSGNAVTIALETIPEFTSKPEEGLNPNHWVKNNSGRNNFRTPSYHRLDVGIDICKQKKNWKRTWSFGAYNVYNHANPFYLYVDTDRTNPGIKQVTLLPFLPFVKYSIKF